MEKGALALILALQHFEVYVGSVGGSYRPQLLNVPLFTTVSEPSVEVVDYVPPVPQFGHQAHCG